MPQRAPCAGCAKPIYISTTSLGKGRSTCRDCRRQVHGAQRYRKGCRCDECRTAHAAYFRDYLDRHPESRRSGGWISHWIRLSIYERDEWVCHLCADPVDPDLRGTRDQMRPSLDHLKPKSRGGSDDPENLRLAHFLCNARRGARPLAAA